MTEEYIEASVKLMKDLQIVDSGDALTRGIGAMTEERVKSFYDKMVTAGLYKPGEVDLSKVATTQFVNKGFGLDIKRRLGGR
jgi:NitT/TauT family transport system substrate-binding protein